MIRVFCVLVLLLALAAPASAQWTSGVHDTGVVRFDVFDNGKLGAFHRDTTSAGGGFVFNGEQGLWEGAFVVGQDFDQVSGSLYDFPGVEWATVAPVVSAPPLDGFDHAFETTYDDSAANPIGLKVTQRSLSRTGDPFVIVAFDIANVSGAALTELYVGAFADWNVDLTIFKLGEYVEEAQLLYAWDPSGTSTNYYGVVALDAPQDVDVTGISYDTTPDEGHLYVSLTFIQPSAILYVYPRLMLGVGPFDLAAGDSVTVAFAYLGGASEAEILAHAQAAHETALLLNGEPSAAGTAGVVLHAAYPNPSRGTTALAFTLDRPQAVRLAVYDVLGREVAVLVDGSMSAGRHEVAFDARRLAGSAYFVRLVAGAGTAAQRVTLLR